MPKMDKNKLATMLISGALVASAGTYAFASQYNQPTQSIVPEVVSSTAISSETASIAESSAVESVTPVESVQSIAESIVSSSAPKEETKTESTVTSTSAEIQSPASQPEQPASTAPAENTSSYVASLTPDTCYYMIIDPGTGEYINARQQGYFELQKQLGGDAGKVPPDQSTACQAALAQYKAKQAAESSTASVK